MTFTETLARDFPGAVPANGIYAEYKGKQWLAAAGLPVPPGFTITTEVCTQLHANGEVYPPGVEAQ